jgi:hypothetical protein
MEGALNQAAYSRIRAVWSGCHNSNYYTSQSTDGATDESGVRGIINLFGSGATFPKSWFRASADLGSPVLYSVSPQHLDNLECRVSNSSNDEWNAALRVHRLNLDACIFSFGGGHEHALAPSMPLPGVAFTAPSYHLLTADQDRELLALVRSKDIRELVLWSDPLTGPNSDHSSQLYTVWNTFNEAYKDVYGPQMYSHSLARGHWTSPDISKLYYALRDRASLTPSNQNQIELNIVFRAVTSDTRNFKVKLATINTGGTGSVSIQRLSSNGTFNGNPPFDQMTAVCDPLGSGFESYELHASTGRSYVQASNGEVHVKVFRSDSHSSPDIAMSLDMVQLFAIDPLPPCTGCMTSDPYSWCAGDYNYDGAVNSDDSDNFVADYAAGLPAADIDGSGTVDESDIAKFWDAYAACGGK